MKPRLVLILTAAAIVAGFVSLTPEPGTAAQQSIRIEAGRWS